MKLENRSKLLTGFFCCWWSEKINGIRKLNNLRIVRRFSRVSCVDTASVSMAKRPQTCIDTEIWFLPCTICHLIDGQAEHFFPYLFVHVTTNTLFVSAFYHFTEINRIHYNLCQQFLKLFSIIIIDFSSESWEWNQQIYSRIFIGWKSKCRLKRVAKPRRLKFAIKRVWRYEWKICFTIRQGGNVRLFELREIN